MSDPALWCLSMAPDLVGLELEFNGAGFPSKQADGCRKKM